MFYGPNVDQFYYVHHVRFIPESPRWLMAEGRFEEAMKILKDGAKINGNTLPPDQELLELMEKFKAQVNRI